MNKEKAVSEQFGEAVKRLKEALDAPRNEITRDSAIKRFELCFDVAWKSVKDFVREKGVECHSPKNCFQAGLQNGLIEIADERDWDEMIKERNLAVHTYDVDLANDIYRKLPTYLALFEKLASSFKKNKR